MKQSFKQLVGECIGEASMCWSITPHGVFDSERASKIVDKILAHVDRKTELEAQIIAHQEAMRPLLKEWAELK
jgi:hypothetical protein